MEHNISFEKMKGLRAMIQNLKVRAMETGACDGDLLNPRIQVIIEEKLLDACLPVAKKNPNFVEVVPTTEKTYDNCFLNKEVAYVSLVFNVKTN